MEATTTMTIRKVLGIVGSLQQVLNAREIKPKYAFRLRRLAGVVQTELEAFNKTRDALIKEIKGDAAEMDKEQEKIFAAKIETVLDEEITLPEIKKFYADELREAKLSAIDLFNLGFLLEEEFEQTK